MQPHQNPYQPGDIVFFDWNQNGEIDHVAIVSEINSMNRPEKMYDATGVINSNPGGLAAELPWEYFHENTVRGFARWSGKYEPVIPDLPKGQVLQAALSAEGLLFQLVGRTGHISSGGVGIAGGRYEDWIWEETISIEQEFSKGDQFLAVIRNPEKKTIPYLFTTQFIENGYINGRIETKGLLKSGEINRIPLLLNEDDEGKIILKYGNLNRHKHGIMRNRR
jgi:hypothetical protein